jgi:hypothetical protein
MKPMSTDQFDLAILYWFYKEPEVTKNHLELMRTYNPERKIYGLFGGAPNDESHYRDLLQGDLDDFWAYPGTYGEDAYTKWIHGDLMILDWYDKRGRSLEWDSIAITQWDMLVLDDVAHVTPGIKKDQVFFSGYRMLDPAIENRWLWTKPGSKHRQDYLNFCASVVSEHDYQLPLRCCLFIYEVLTREFFDGYLTVSDKKLGMLEYKCPTLADVLGLDIYQRDIGVFWGDPGQSVAASPLNAITEPIANTYITSELAKPDGWRVFHPYEEVWQ